MLKNNIRELLDIKEISIRYLSKNINMDYSNVYNLVHRDSLDNTRAVTLVKIANSLNVNVEELWIEIKN